MTLLYLKIVACPLTSFWALARRSSVCNIAQLPSGPDGQPAFLHHNLRKPSVNYGGSLHRLAEALVPGHTTGRADAVACQTLPVRHPDRGCALPHPEVA